MLGRSHVTTGVCVGILALSSGIPTLQLQPLQQGIFLIAVAIGSLLPDIDHPQSIIARQIPIMGGIVGRLVQHRGYFHSIVGMISIFSGAWVLIQSGQALTVPEVGLTLSLEATIAQLIWLGALIGYINHIVGDMLTVSGVKLFYPLPFNVGIPLIRTNSIFESLLVIGAMGATGAWIYTHTIV